MPKTLVICCDGTWNTPDQKGAPTNVTKMVRAVLTRARNGDPQTVYYDKGVGTGDGLDRFLGGTIGLGLGANVQEAYSFLAVNYEPGDRIVMFGFSRGAYTVRSLAGMVNLAGVLHKGDLDRLEDVWNHYRTKPEERRPDALKDIVRLVDRQPGVELLGVWDTVGSLGIPGNLLGRIGRRRYEFHDVTLSRKTKRAYQALVIDEHRRNFLPAIWDTSQIGPDQDVDQVWFAGAHSNIGGGYPDPVLSDQAFLWMVNKAKPLLDFDEDYLERRVRKLREDKAEGVIIDSIKGVWKLLGRTLRLMGRDRTEGVHPSVLVRLRTNGTYAEHEQPFKPYPYRPANLLVYLKSRGMGV